ncbi:MAG: serine hydrolase [Chitinophagaceae bacterium]|nr:serine hydrolase [Chitinophagaceae bacterium]
MARPFKTYYSFIISLIIICTLSCKTTQKAGSSGGGSDTTIAAITSDTTIINNSPAVKHTKTDALPEKLLRNHPEYFSDILARKDAYRVQVIYTQIDRDENNTPSFRDHYFNVDEDNYFYPASTVKMPTALLALQKLHELNIPALRRNTPMVSGTDYNGQTAVYNDPTSVDGCPSIEQYIKKIFLVSDNDAFNRLYEFLGQEYTNRQLHQKGYTYAAINHRLEVFLSQDENRHTNPVQFRDTSGNIIYNQPMQFNQVPYPQRNDAVGKGYYQGGILINEPMNFSNKNRITLPELHNILRSIIFPASVAPSRRFNITAEDHRFVLQYMSQLPSETTYPPYSTTYYDAYCKFLLLGGDKAARLPDGVRIFNKVGDAYGFLLDVAYIADFKNKVECMLSAVIYCNADEILNDDTYDYNITGLPFMKHLGEVIYQYELKRKRKHLPDLEAFRLQYDR